MVGEDDLVICWTRLRHGNTLRLVAIDHQDKVVAREARITSYHLRFATRHRTTEDAENALTGLLRATLDFKVAFGANLDTVAFHGPTKTHVWSDPFGAPTYLWTVRINSYTAFPWKREVGHVDDWHTYGLCLIDFCRRRRRRSDHGADFPTSVRASDAVQALWERVGCLVGAVVKRDAFLDPNPLERMANASHRVCPKLPFHVCCMPLPSMDEAHGVLGANPKSSDFIGAGDAVLESDAVLNLPTNAVVLSMRANDTLANRACARAGCLKVPLHRLHHFLNGKHVEDFALPGTPAQLDRGMAMIELVVEMARLVRVPFVKLLECNRLELSRLAVANAFEEASSLPPPRYAPKKRQQDTRAYQGGHIFECAPGLHGRASLLDFDAHYGDILLTRSRDVFDGKGVEPVVDLVDQMLKRKRDVMHQSKTTRAASKLWVNTLYGALGSHWSPIMMLDAANAITAIGRERVQHLADQAQSVERPLIFGHTDSIVVSGDANHIELGADGPGGLLKAPQTFSAMWVMNRTTFAAIPTHQHESTLATAFIDACMQSSQTERVPDALGAWDRFFDKTSQSLEAPGLYTSLLPPVINGLSRVFVELVLAHSINCGESAAAGPWRECLDTMVAITHGDGPSFGWTVAMSHRIPYKPQAHPLGPLSDSNYRDVASLAMRERFNELPSGFLDPPRFLRIVRAASDNQFVLLRRDDGMRADVDYWMDRFHQTWSKRVHATLNDESGAYRAAMLMLNQVRDTFPKACCKREPTARFSHVSTPPKTLDPEIARLFQTILPIPTSVPSAETLASIHVDDMVAKEAIDAYIKSVVQALKPCPKNTFCAFDALLMRLDARRTLCLLAKANDQPAAALPNAQQLPQVEQFDRLFRYALESIGVAIHASQSPLCL